MAQRGEWWFLLKNQVPVFTQILIGEWRYTKPKREVSGGQTNIYLCSISWVHSKQGKFRGVLLVARGRVFGEGTAIWGSPDQYIEYRRLPPDHMQERTGRGGLEQVEEVTERNAWDWSKTRAEGFLCVPVLKICLRGDVFITCSAVKLQFWLMIYPCVLKNTNLLWSCIPFWFFSLLLRTCVLCHVVRITWMGVHFQFYSVLFCLG